MPNTPADSNLDAKQAPKIDPGPRKNPGKPSVAPDWRTLLWYIPIMLLILWVWQDQLHQLSVKTIPYSQFKQYLAAGEVAECEVTEREITGRVVPKESRSQAATLTVGHSNESKPVALPGKSSHPAVPGRSPSIAADKAAPTTMVDSSKEEKARGETAKNKGGGSGEQAASKDATKKQEEAKSYLFRTERVEPDTQLVDQLEAAKVTFSGVRPSFLSQLLYAWVLPIGAMLVLWIFLSRGMRTAGQSVMSFGKSRARLAADRDTAVTFDDVAGCDEAKCELQEVVDFLKNPGRYIALGARIPKGVLLVGLPNGTSLSEVLG